MTLKSITKLAVVGYTFDPSTQEAGAGRFLNTQINILLIIKSYLIRE